MEDQKKTDADYVLSVDLADKPSEAVHVEMAAKEVGDIQPVDLSKKEVPVDRAFEIQRIFHELPPELIASLDKTLAKGEQEHDDLLQALVGDVDEWGRQEISKLKAEVQNKVRTYMSMESTDIQEVRQRCREDKKRIKSEAKKSMKAIQERLNVALKALTADLDTDIEVLRMKYKDMYARSEACLKRDTDLVTERVASLVGPLPELSTEQLLELKHSAVQGGGEDDKQQEDS